MSTIETNPRGAVPPPAAGSANPNRGSEYNLAGVSYASSEARQAGAEAHPQWAAYRKWDNTVHCGYPDMDDAEDRMEFEAFLAGLAGSGRDSQRQALRLAGRNLMISRREKNQKRRAEELAKASSEQHLVGWHCAVPRLNNRGRWWVEVVAQSTCGRFAKVKGNIGFGAPRWVAVEAMQEPKPPRREMPANE